MLKHSEEPLARHDNRLSTASERTTGSWTILLLVLFFAARHGFLVLDRAWLMSLGKFLLTGIILAAAFC
ncbi:MULTISPECIES: hypothetical protein [Bradyrhizobium]|uniref:hypothetical protein n=1 Tax=Bradyrhizobium TaxID=374 RepID=UPI001FEB990F|nr:hypothetical protein [Bradyrhizobium liaoningense]GMP00223.1 hypothetical protein TM239_24500 [Bradyrhizobium sp. TM239]